MFQEYTLAKGNDLVVLRRQAFAFLPHAMALLIAGLVLKMTEHEMVRGGTRPSWSLLIFLIALVIAFISQYFASKKFRMISTDTGLNWSSRGTQVNVRYADMTRIEKDQMGTLYIFTHTSDKMPVILLTRLLTNIDQLEEFLARFVPVTSQVKQPLMLRAEVRMVFSFIYMLCMFLNILSRSIPIMQVTLLVFIVAMSIGLSFSFRFRKEISIWKNVTLQFVLLLLMIFKTVVFMLMASR